MKIIIEAEPKEIADLVLKLQDRQEDKFVAKDSSGIRDSRGSISIDH